jgi:3-hydroxyacyl-CoA dehydrogenase/enoyl-CoA hydratase/3-hydroxybutyryl-CoA epimerase
MSSMTTSTALARGRDILTVIVRPDGVAVVVIDDRDESVNTITRRFGEELRAFLQRFEREDAIKAAVLTSGKKDSFFVGANLEMVRSITTAEEAASLSREFAAAMRGVELGKKPVVAAVHGAALGGGFEIALACHAIVCTDDPRTVVGIPEVKLGLMPACNGLQRIAARAGLRAALDLGLTGKSVRAARAKKQGLVDEVCPRNVLVEVACKRALALAEKPTRRRAKVDPAAIALEKNPLGRALLFKKVRAETRKKTLGHYPATEKIIDVVELFAKRGFQASATLEAQSFGELVVSETAHRLMEIFFATTALKKDTGVDDPKVAVEPIEQLGIIGGGLMGAGIAYVSLTQGIDVRLRDKDDEGVARALKHVAGLLDGRVERKRMTRLERDLALGRLTTTIDGSGLKHADVVIEAVFEDLDLKQRVLRDVEAHTSDRCIFASNTSSIPIAEIAQASKRPQNVLGMHYFSPVDKMPLLEVIRTEQTSKRAIATAVALGKRQGKTVIVVKDGPGFYTTRILAPYMNEASRLVLEGVPIDVLDEALVAWGFPVGPAQLLDEVGLDVGAHVGAILERAFGARLAQVRGFERLASRKGRKNGRGLYLYGPEADAKAKRSRRPVDESVYADLGVTKHVKLPREEIQMRCVLRMVNEAIHCLGEGVLRTARDGDVGAVFGLGFPPFRGGPLRYADVLGAPELLRRLRGYEDRLGPRFSPAPLLLELEKTGKKLHGDATRSV